MKRAKLKSIIENLVRETVIRKLSEGQPIGGVKNDHEFDAGRNNVMKAVNVGENTNEILGLFRTKKSSNDIDMNQVRGHIRNALNQTKDRIKAISLLTQAQQKSTDAKLRDEYTTAIHYIKTARDLRQYMDSPNGEREPDFNNEMIGQDGRYSDDMESGVAVKKLHNLSEQKPSKKQLFIYPENFRAAKNYIRVSKKPDTGEFVVAWFTNGKRNEPKCYYTNDAVDAWNTFAVTKMEVDKANNGSAINEIGFGFGIGLTVGAGATFIYRIIKDLIKFYASNRKLKAETPLSQKIIDSLLIQAKQKNSKLKNDDIDLVRNAIMTAFNNKTIKTVGDLMTFIKEVFTQQNNVNEESSTGGVAGYSTPYAFSRKKSGSQRAMDVTTKMGYKKVKDISQE